MSSPYWLSAFLDFAPADVDTGVRFWGGVTGYPLSPARGPRAEFATLIPPEGDAYLKVQRLGAGPSRLHLDLHTADPQATAAGAVDAGARVVTARDEHGYVVLASPGGITFCCVLHPGGQVPRPATWTSDGQPFTSRLDQVCLDLPEQAYASETAFWSTLLEAPLIPSPTHREFARITPAWAPLRILVQRLEEPTGPARLHLDLAADDRRAEVERHRSLGAEVVREHDVWTVLSDPVGLLYCVTERTPWPV